MCMVYFWRSASRAGQTQEEQGHCQRASDIEEGILGSDFPEVATIVRALVDANGLSGRVLAIREDYLDDYSTTLASRTPFTRWGSAC